jgi:hypothetical protein
MALRCGSPPEFKPNDRVVSFVSHPPEIQPGTKATIVSPHHGSLYAVQLPSGELHQWFAGSELQPVNMVPGYSRLLRPGSSAKVMQTNGHPSHITAGMVVRIIQTLELVPFYDLMLDGHGYHRWLAEFEIAPIYAFAQPYSQ